MRFCLPGLLMRSQQRVQATPQRLHDPQIHVLVQRFASRHSLKNPALNRLADGDCGKIVLGAVDELVSCYSHSHVLTSIAPNLGWNCVDPDYSGSVRPWGIVVSPP